MQRAPVQPCLPNPADAPARRAMLATPRSLYVWDDDVPSLPQVPLSKQVPPNDHPTLEWLLIVVGVGLALARNTLALKAASVAKGELAETNASIVADQTKCDAIEASLASISKALAAAQIGTAIERDIADVVLGIDYVAQDVNLALLQTHVTVLRTIIELTDLERHQIGSSTTPSLEAFRGLFDTIRPEAIAYTFVEDDEFARLRVAGPNAVLLKNISQLPSNFALSPQKYAEVVAGDALSEALGAGRIFLCDYAELKVLEAGQWDGIPKFVYQPMALFAVPPQGDALVPVAIQCGQAPDSRIFMPSDVADKRWDWEVAKFIVQVADGNYHELLVHLARTHLVIEAFAVATHRNLPPVHPLWALLLPHFEGTLNINNLAAGSLIAAGGPIDHIFGGTITSSQQAAVQDRLAFDFYGHMLPADLANRGVAATAPLADYPYRDDGLLVWNAIQDWATRYINIYYPDDAAVAGDTELAAWQASLALDGKINGFCAITNKVQLAQVCTMIIFTASAQHAAVNFPQRDIMSFAPAVTGAGWAAEPTMQSGFSKADWLSYMPPLALGLEQLNVLYLLGSVHYRPLGDYRSNDFPYPNWFQDPQIIGEDCALPSFQSALLAVESEIKARNAARMVSYPYMQPSLIPTSINI